MATNLKLATSSTQAKPYKIRFGPDRPSLLMHSIQDSAQNSPRRTTQSQVNGRGYSLSQNRTGVWERKRGLHWHRTYIHNLDHWFPCGIRSRCMVKPNMALWGLWGKLWTSKSSKHQYSLLNKTNVIAENLFKTSNGPHTSPTSVYPKSLKSVKMRSC